MATKILFQIAAEDLGVATKLEAIRDRQKEINAAIRDAKKIGKPYDSLIQELSKTRVETGKLREEQRNLNKEFKAAQFPKDSVIGMRLEYSKLTDQINKLSAAQRNSDFGKNLISQAANVKRGIDGVEQSIGRFTGNVGNYKSALTGVGDLITGGLVTGGIVAGIAAVGKVMEIGAQQAIAYDKALSDLSALTGLTGDALASIDTIARGLQSIQVEGAQIVNTGPDILNAMKLVGGARPELLGSAEALGEVTKQAIILGQASGDTLDNSVKALTTTLGQFDLRGTDSARVINELAAGAKVGAAEIPQITDALREFGTVAAISNVSTGESVALVELLADKQLKGAEAGTQLRNVLSKLAAADILPRTAQEQFAKLGIDINVLKDSTLPLKDRLAELGKAQGDLSALTKVFGLENLQAATIITSGLDKYDALKAGIEGTNEAFIQAEIRANSFSQRLENLQNKALNKLGEGFGSATASGGQLISVFDFLIDKVNVLGFVADTAIGPLKILLDRFNEFRQFVSGEPDAQQGAFFDISGAKDETDALLKEVQALKTVGEEGAKATRTIAEMRKEVKTLKAEIANTAPGSEAARKLTGQLALTKSELAKAEQEAGLAKTPKDKGPIAAAGSVAFLRDQVAKLQKEIEATNAESPLLAKLISDLKKVDLALKLAEARVNALKNPAGRPTTELEDANAGLLTLGGVKESDADKLKKDLDDLAAQLSASVGITIPVEADTDGFESALFELQQKENEIAEKEAAKRKEKRDNLNEEIKAAAFDTANTIAGGVFQIQEAQLQKEQDARQEALDAKLANDLAKAKGNAKKEALIRADYEKKKAALEKEGAEKRKKIAKTEAIIQGALAVIRALAIGNFVLAAAAAVATGVEIAVIDAQQFARGGQIKRQPPGMVKQRPNAPQTPSGDNILAYLQNREVVLNRAQQHRLQQRAGRSILADIGVPGINITNTPRLASGGAIDFVPQAGFRSNLQQASQEAGLAIQSIAAFSDDQVKVLGANLGVIIASEVSRQVRVAMGQGLNDANRRIEREASLEANRKG